MKQSFSFKARGHSNVKATHKTTVMTTTETHLTPRGNCIVAIAAEKGIIDLPPEFKKAARSHDAEITMTLETGGHVFKVTGKGHPGLTFEHPKDIVTRKSNYICERTLMVGADKAACDIDTDFVAVLAEDKEITITITALL
ncbi:MAG: DUF371 domain-containing protein [Candidatus Bathyarchaeota archaeon]|nr:DUF371 domain-containing protein [Candidatus Bathyarchaeota archaeon]